MDEIILKPQQERTARRLANQYAKFDENQWALHSKLSDSLHHCVKCVQIRSISWSVFPVFELNTGKYGPEKTPYWDTFHAVLVNFCTSSY